MLDDLQRARREKWRAAGNPVRTLEDAREFLADVGFCPMYLQRPALVAPTLIGACTGSEENLPEQRKAFSDPHAQEASELMVRLLREKSAYEVNLAGENHFLVSAEIFPYFYALLGDRNPKGEQGKPSTPKLTPLANDVFETIYKRGAITKRDLLTVIGRGVSDAALERALNELWSVLRITRIGYSPEDGATWSTLQRWSPEAVKQGIQISVPHAISALLGQYLQTVIAAEQSDVERLFGMLTPVSKVRDSIQALLAARVLRMTAVGGRTMLQVSGTVLPERQATADAQAPGSENGGQATIPATSPRARPSRDITRVMRTEDAREGSAARADFGGMKPEEGAADRQRTPLFDRKKKPPRSAERAQQAPSDSAAGRRGEERPVDQRRKPSFKRARPEFGRPGKPEFAQRPKRDDRKPQFGKPKQQQFGKPKFAEHPRREDRPPAFGKPKFEKPRFEQPGRPQFGERPKRYERDSERRDDRRDNRGGAQQPLSGAAFSGRERAEGRGGFAPRAKSDDRDRFGSRPQGRVARDFAERRPFGNRPTRTGTDRADRAAGDRPAKAYGGDRSQQRPAADRPQRRLGSDRSFGANRYARSTRGGFDRDAAREARGGTQFERPRRDDKGGRPPRDGASRSERSGGSEKPKRERKSPKLGWELGRGRKRDNEENT